ncbi:MAG: SIMPL domain-containing protein [Dehalococcoidia bacterium]
MPGAQQRSGAARGLGWAAPLAAGAAVALLLRRRGGRPRPARARVRGGGLITATPDIVTVTMGVETRDETPSAAFTRSAERADQLLGALRAAGVADTDIRTADIGLQPEYTTAPDKAAEIVGWRASHMLSVKLRTLDRVPEILQRGVELLGTDGRVQSIQFGIEDTNALLSRARKSAFANARAAGEEIAAAAGLQLGPLLGVEDQATASPTPRPFMRSAGGVQAMALAVSDAGSVMPGQMEVRAFVTATFALVRR